MNFINVLRRFLKWIHRSILSPPIEFFINLHREVREEMLRAKRIEDSKLQEQIIKNFQMEPIVYYRDNPNLGTAVVKTQSGKTEYRKNCKKIKGELYVMFEECFPVNGTWYRQASGKIEKDWETGQWFLISEPPRRLNHGIVGFTPNGTPIMGSFTPNKFKNVPVYYNGENYIALNEDILLAAGFGEKFSTGVWFSLRDMKPNDLQKLENVLDHTRQGYNVEDNPKEFEQKKASYDEFKTELSKDVRAYAKMLGDTSFGVEVECTKGFLPNNIQYQLGVLICRDGSLNDENGRPGPEFVTVPMTGAKGLQTISNLGKELTKRTGIDLKCSYHIHLGNLPTSRLYLVTLFRLGNKIQDEVFKMFPYYKTNPEGIKNKNYNQKLPTLSIYAASPTMSKEEFDAWVNESYKKMAAWLGEGYQQDNVFNRKTHNHPVAQKWNRSKRYFWLNMMNAIWSGRNTVEFRPHTPTTNSQKMINWLFICNAICKFAEIHYREILFSKTKNITLDQVLEYYENNFGRRGKLLTDYLKAYVNERKAAFQRDYKNGDMLSKWEYEKDKSYVFRYENLTHLF